MKILTFLSPDLFYWHLHVCVLVAQSYLTLCDPMNYSLPGSSVHGILQASILEWVANPSPGDLPDPGIKPGSPTSQVDSSPIWAVRESHQHLHWSPVYCVEGSLPLSVKDVFISHPGIYLKVIVALLPLFSTSFSLISWCKCPTAQRQANTDLKAIPIQHAISNLFPFHKRIV